MKGTVCEVDEFTYERGWEPPEIFKQKNETIISGI